MPCLPNYYRPIPPNKSAALEAEGRVLPGLRPARLVRRGDRWRAHEREDLDLRELAGLRRRRLHRGQAREGRAGLCEDFPA